MLYRADVSDKALGLLMDRCRATFANPEADGGFTLYTHPNRNQVKYRVTAEMHRAAQKCIKSGFPRLRGNVDPVQIDSGIRVRRQFHQTRVAQLPTLACRLTFLRLRVP